MTTTPQPYHQPLGTTVIRNALIAIVLGTVLAMSTRSGHPIRWPVAVALMLWPSFGGHWIEVWYLNWLAPRLPAGQVVRRVARLFTWFVGGCGLGIGMLLTARALGAPRVTRWTAGWLAGTAFVGVELIAHGVLQLRGQRSFFNGRG